MTRPPNKALQLTAKPLRGLSAAELHPSAASALRHGSRTGFYFRVIGKYG